MPLNDSARRRAIRRLCRVDGPRACTWSVARAEILLCLALHDVLRTELDGEAAALVADGWEEEATEIAGGAATFTGAVGVAAVAFAGSEVVLAAA